MTRHGSSSDTLASFATLGVIVVAIAALLLVARTVAEIVRVYAARAHDPVASRFLWGALLVLLVLWMVAGMAATIPGLQPTAVYLAAWAFLSYVIAVETIDQRCLSRDQELLGQLGDLETYLADFEPRRNNGRATSEPGLARSLT